MDRPPINRRLRCAAAWAKGKDRRTVKSMSRVLRGKGRRCRTRTTSTGVLRDVLGRPFCKRTPSATNSRSELDSSLAGNVKRPKADGNQVMVFVGNPGCSDPTQGPCTLSSAGAVVNGLPIRFQSAPFARTKIVSAWPSKSRRETESVTRVEHLRRMILLCAKMFGGAQNRARRARTVARDVAA